MFTGGTKSRAGRYITNELIDDLKALEIPTYPQFKLVARKHSIPYHHIVHAHYKAYWELRRVTNPKKEVELSAEENLMAQYGPGNFPYENLKHFIETRKVLKSKCNRPGADFILTKPFVTDLTNLVNPTRSDFVELGKRYGLGSARVPHRYYKAFICRCKV